MQVVAAIFMTVAYTTFWMYISNIISLTIQLGWGHPTKFNLKVADRC